MCTESYLTEVLCTHCRSMVLVIMVLSIIGKQCMLKVQFMYMTRCNTVLLSPNIEGMK